MSLKDRIAAADDLTSEPMDIPEWGVTVDIKAMTGQARADLLSSFAGEDGKVDYARTYPDLVIVGTFDPETGDPVFGPDDTEMLLTKSAVVLERVAQKVMQVNGLGEKAVDEAGKSSLASDVESATPNAASTSN